MTVVEDLGVECEVILYLKTPPDRQTLERIVAGLEDPVEDLVRKDAKFQRLGLDPADYVNNPDAVIEVLTKHKQLMQRPLVVKGKKAIIGRPQERIAGFLA